VRDDATRNCLTTRRLEAGDELLFAGTRAAKAAQNLTLDNRTVLDYVLTGQDAQGLLWRWFNAKKAVGDPDSR
jgi:hypothetical protein